MITLTKRKGVQAYGKWRSRCPYQWKHLERGVISYEKIVEIIEKVFDLRPTAIIDALDIRRPIYKQTAAYGHFGRDDIDLPWEHLDKIAERNCI